MTPAAPMRRFLITGHTADGRTWMELVEVAPALFPALGRHFLLWLASRALAWDAHHHCHTGRLLFQAWPRARWG